MSPRFLTTPCSQETRQEGGKLHGGEMEREEGRESGGGQEKERLMKNTGMGGRQKN